MSRNKKSRKPGVGSSGVVKDDKKKVVVATNKKPKKKTGKKPGNRQQEAVAKQTQQNPNSANKDPRIGSKKPIALAAAVVSSTKKPAKPVKTKTSPIAAIRTVEPIEDHAALEQELYAIEDDSKLQLILAKQEDDIALSESEVDFFNATMERHQEIRHILGWNDEDEDQVSESNVSDNNDSDDEESLWDKLDHSDLSSFDKE